MRSPRGITALATALAALLLTAACASGHRAARPARPGTASPPAAGPRAASQAGPEPRTLDDCFTATRGTIETVADAGGATLTLGIVGTGPRVVVLSNQSDENLCSWRPVSARLAASIPLPLSVTLSTTLALVRRSRTRAREAAAWR